ncbi:Fungal specific transcription factor domain [Rhizoctonia solani]|uniref:Fungal specific transcription factor domain n=1 Tax=Rhizoctonia solani TaxID=456999 RepID=A0A8H7M4C4_9AGAM|nr:Fungal specific transcription factor domain [Rhizoctonia solani]
MSFATAFSDKPIVKAKETRAHFASCAKQHLEKECDRPTITVVQALTFLSDYHASLGERGLAYLYFGMSCRMVRALGLCIDSRPWVESQRITQEELVARDCNFGQHSAKVTHIHYPYSSHRLHMGSDKIMSDYEGLLRGMQAYAFWSADYGSCIFSRPSKLEVTQKDSVSDIHLNLDTWYNNLPESLTIQLAPPPNPFHTSYPFGVERLNGNPSSFTDLSVKICDRATVKIVHLVMLFDKCYGMRYFPLSMLQVIFMAGATLLVQSASLSETAVKKRADAHEGTRKCVYALQAAAQTWDCAKISASYLQSLLQEQTAETNVQMPANLQAQPPSADSSPVAYSHPALPSSTGPAPYGTLQHQQLRSFTANSYHNRTLSN